MTKKKAPKAKQKKQIRDGAVQERDFFGDVMDVVRKVPKGRVTSYGAIARYIGAARSARLVGYCMNNAHVVKPSVPAHRVVNSAGLLTGKHHFATPTRMADLLKKEGVQVKKDQVVDFKKKFWDPGMRADIIAHLDKGGAGLDPLVRSAIAQLRGKP